MALSYPPVRSYIKQELVTLIDQRFSEAEAVAGVATAGIPQGVLAADQLELPFMYVRSQPKEHGMTNIIEGEVVKGQKVVVVEDLVSTGGSSLKAVAALELMGLEVIGVIAVFTYGFDRAREAFAKASLPFVSLSSYDILIREAVEQNLISISDLSSLRDWRESPETWGR